ncbi:hypothetical protein AGMMS49925_05140 [Deltaproteobacteria bacterium]|nr:hypothetical protein AGMMS49925_05140 [Deltaproteobacteria bacterium]
MHKNPSITSKWLSTAEVAEYLGASQNFLAGVDVMWTVKIHKKVKKTLKTPSVPVQKAVELLTFELRAGGPVAGTWPNYGKLGDNKHHCHLKKGKPAYVAVWLEVKKETQTIEVTYVGTHGKAPY